MNMLAVIPARGGSKRLPRKNILPFCGKPMFAWTLEAALQSQLFSQVLVSTEDEEIAAATRQFGGNVVKRPLALAGDDASVAQVCRDILEQEKSQGRTYDVICCCYATAPLRTAEDICNTVALLEKGVCDFSFAVTNYSHYPHQALRMDEKGFLNPLFPDLVRRRGADIGKVRAGNGSTYAAFVSEYLHCGDFYGDRMKGYEMPFLRSVDIDTQEDLDLATAIAGHLNWHI